MRKVFCSFTMIFVVVVCLFATVVSAKNDNKAVYMGFFKDSVKTYFPKAVVDDVFHVNNSHTTGYPKAGNSKVDQIQNTIGQMRRDAKGFAVSQCTESNYQYAAIDNVDIEISSFGDSNLNSIVTLTANVVCFH